MKLYYNAHHPVEILESRTILTSTCNGRNRGLSMSSKLIDSHGPFTFVFKPDRHWYNQFQQVIYTNDHPIDFTHKLPMFQDEFEYWSPSPVHFQLDDILHIIFRLRSAGASMQPRVTKRRLKELKSLFPALVA